MSVHRFLAIAALVAGITPALSGPSWGLQSCKCGPGVSDPPTAGTFAQSSACVRTNPQGITAGTVPGVVPGGNPQQGDTFTVVK